MQLEEKVPAVSKSTRLPRKRFYRARAHSNPLSIGSNKPNPIHSKSHDPCMSLHEINLILFISFESVCFPFIFAKS
ncbi:putative tRNA (guanine(46)-N(7))-methyltransferase [Helianthus debilis subsp. tardiflorus]